MTLRRRLILYFSATTTGILLLCVWAIVPLHDGLVSLGSFHGPSLTQIQEMQSNAKNAIQESFSYVISGDPQEKQEYLDWAPSFNDEALRFEQIAKLHEPGEEAERELFERCKSDAQAMIAMANLMITEFELHEDISEQTIWSYEQSIDEFIASTTELIEIEKAEVTAAQEAALSIIGDGERHLVIIGVLGLLAAASIGYSMARRIVSPLESLSNAAKQMGRGDFSQRVELETGDELELLGHAFNQMSADLGASRERLVRSERLAILGQLTSSVSHELRNPLGALRTSMSTVKQLATDREGALAEVVAIGDRSIDRCDRIITELLEFARISPPEREPIAVDEWLEKELDEYPLAPAITLERSINSGLTVDLDPARMHQVLVNVLDNACQSMQELESDSAQVLSVSASSIGDHLEIVIGDTGPGVAADELHRVFEPLISTKSFGFGLGLPIVRQIMDRHSGEVRLANKAEGGAELYLRLPIKTPTPELTTASAGS